tara:strand:+ start:700 stop:1035 length:336 start_codon:yes stop_codon:yes gene_type:complete
MAPMQKFKVILMLLSITILSNCVSGTAVEEMHTRKYDATDWIPPKILKADENGLKIRYMDNEAGATYAIEVPQDVLNMASRHCDSYDKDAFWIGNKRSLIPTLSVGTYKCR